MVVCSLSRNPGLCWSFEVDVLGSSGRWQEFEVIGQSNEVRTAPLDAVPVFPTKTPARALFRLDWRFGRLKPVTGLEPCCFSLLDVILVYE